ncbi:hypothetical protein Naga_102312g1, partial [Nannochloropsis gaditana]
AGKTGPESDRGRPPVLGGDHKTEDVRPHLRPAGEPAALKSELATRGAPFRTLHPRLLISFFKRGVCLLPSGLVNGRADDSSHPRRGGKPRRKVRTGRGRIVRREGSR